MPSPLVRTAVSADRTILLDLCTERYLGLDEVGTALWARLLEADSKGASLQIIVEALTLEFDVSREVLERDLGSLVKRLVKSGVVIVARAEEAQPAPTEPSGLRCALTLVAAALALRLLGLRRSLAMARRVERPAPWMAPPTREFLARVVRKLDVVASFFPGRALCLERSLTLCVLLRRSGITATLQIGAHPYPFAAHAWVEYDGAPVGDSRERVDKFVPFQGLGF